jgi:2-polyprenyl-3-methyl-5-hydroxy-6-metoxy-1,4-benzoquinol methylase
LCDHQRVTTSDAAGRDPGYLRALTQRDQKAAGFTAQILETTAPFLAKPRSELEVLDVGSGRGHIALELAAHCQTVTGIEPSAVLYASACELQRASGRQNLAFRRAGIEDISDAAAFDLIVLDNVFEHLPNQPDSLRRLHRALRPGGAIYILTPNKLWPIEAHYGLPFLSWLPLPLANRYLRLTGRGTDYEDASYAPTYGRLRRLLREAGLPHEFVLPMNLSNTDGGNALHYRIGAALIRRLPAMWRISKGFLVVAYKPQS